MKYFVITSLLILFGCTGREAAIDSRPPARQEPIVFGDALPVKLEPDTTIIHLEDFVLDLKNVDKVIAPIGFSQHLSTDGRLLRLITSSEIPALNLLTFTKGAHKEVVLMKKSSKKKYHFTFDPKGKTYKKVQLVGDVNAWNPQNTPLQFKNGKWETTLYLNPGTYGFQVVLDGKWMLDPNNPEKIENGIGGWNSPLVVKGVDKDKLPQINHLNWNNKQLEIAANNPVKEYIALWRNKRITIQDGIVSIPTEAKKIKRSTLRIWAYNDFGASPQVFIPLEYGIPVFNPQKLNRNDKRTNILYFPMVDRFCDGNPSNNRPLLDKEVRPRADFHGGDIRGIIKKLDEGYFTDLGMTAIWLSPIVKNPEGAFGFYNKGGVKSKFSAFHGYWPVSFTLIDDRFGTPDDLKELVAKAHAKGINIFLDFIANHVHENHPVYQANKDNGWATDLYLPDGTLNTEKWDEHRLTTWFDTFLPTLNLERKEITEMLSDSALFWIKTYDIDGFRHDATKHIPEIFWRTLTKKIKLYEKESGKTIFQIGETYGTPDLISSYIGSGMLEGQFDFNVFDALLATICQDDKNWKSFHDRLQQSFDYYGIHNLMGYITGNQDKPRLMAIATGDVRFDEDSKLAGWTRDIHKKTKTGYQRAAMMHAVILTIPGIPVIYYGDEIGLTGGNDPDNRRMMKFDELSPDELALRDKVSQLAKLRRNNMALMYGDIDFLQVDKDVLIYARHYFDEEVVVVLNKSKSGKVLEVPLREAAHSGWRTHFGSKMDIQKKKIILELPPIGFEVLTYKNK